MDQGQTPLWVTLLAAFLSGGLGGTIAGIWIAKVQATTEKMKLRFEVMRRRVQHFDKLVLDLQPRISDLEDITGTVDFLAGTSFLHLLDELNGAAGLVCRDSPDHAAQAKAGCQAGLALHEAAQRADSAQADGTDEDEMKESAHAFLRARQTLRSELHALHALVDQAAEDRL